MAINRDSTPPPKIGKIGPYTVFMTPPSTPKPSEQPPMFDSPKKVVLPPVQPPPQQFVKPVAADGSVLGFFKNAVTKVQNGTGMGAAAVFERGDRTDELCNARRVESLNFLSKDAR